MNQKKKNRRWKIVSVAIIGIMVMLAAACAIYVYDGYGADKTALEALESDDVVKVERLGGDIIVFSPKEPEEGLIFYPGGKVEFTAYAPLLHNLAEEGVLCVLIKMPCNLAVLDMDAAEGLQEKFPDVREWYMGGHSLGGAMAAGYVAGHIDEYEGLILLAAYPTEDISRSGLKALSVYGSEDGVLDMEKYTESLSKLPENREEHVIKGGCHAQFGSYGRQKGDGEPTISGREQIEITVSYIMDWLGQDERQKME